MSLDVWVTRFVIFSFYIIWIVKHIPSITFHKIKYLVGKTSSTTVHFHPKGTIQKVRTLNIHRFWIPSYPLHPFIRFRGTQFSESTHVYRHYLPRVAIWICWLFYFSKLVHVGEHKIITDLFKNSCGNDPECVAFIREFYLFKMFRK